jgi:hypothetical protein
LSGETKHFLLDFNSGEYSDIVFKHPFAVEIKVLNKVTGEKN